MTEVSTAFDRDANNNRAETTAAFATGAKSSIGASALQLVAAVTPAVQGVLVKAALANTGKVYVGGSNAVTAGSADATDGFELAAGEGVLVEVDDASKIYVIGSATGQKVFWTAQ